VGRERRGLVAAILAAGAGSLTLPVAATPALPVLLAQGGCAGDDCDADQKSWGSCAQGERLDANTWESGPVAGTPYLDFHGERTWVFDPSPWMGARQPVGFQVYLALDPQPSGEGGTGFAQPAGNLAEITPVKVGDAWKVLVLNNTCAQYYLRVVLTYAATDGGAATTGSCGAAGAG